MEHNVQIQLLQREWSEKKMETNQSSDPIHGVKLTQTVREDLLIKIYMILFKLQQLELDTLDTSTHGSRWKLSGC